MNKIDPKISDTFAKGLAVFSGKSKYGKILRGKFTMAESVVEDADTYYIDEWFPGHFGGGQEVLEVGGQRYTRVYAGGTVEDSIIAPLGITKDDVMGSLKNFLMEAGGRTRFDLRYQKDSLDWRYRYVPGEQDETSGMITGKEVITFKHTPVFTHFFIISRVWE
jgi:hypothetical protein